MSRQTLLCIKIYDNPNDLFRYTCVYVPIESLFDIAFILQESSRCVYFTVSDYDRLIPNTEYGNWRGLTKWIAMPPYKIEKEFR